MVTWVDLSFFFGAEVDSSGEAPRLPLRLERLGVDLAFGGGRSPGPGSPIWLIEKLCSSPADGVGEALGDGIRVSSVKAPLSDPGPSLTDAGEATSSPDAIAWLRRRVSTPFWAANLRAADLEILVDMILKLFS